MFSMGTFPKTLDMCVRTRAAACTCINATNARRRSHAAADGVTRRRCRMRGSYDTSPQSYPHAHSISRSTRVLGCAWCRRIRPGHGKSPLGLPQSHGPGVSNRDSAPTSKEAAWPTSVGYIWVVQPVAATSPPSKPDHGRQEPPAAYVHPPGSLPEQGLTPPPPC